MTTLNVKEKQKDLAPVPSHVAGEVEHCPPYAHDAVFGELNEDGPNYRNVGWLGTIILMMKTQIGLGVLSIPSTFDSLGMIPGIICLCAIAAMTTWSNYIVGTFKLRHPEVYGIDDVGGLMFGRLGREVFGMAIFLYWTFVAGSAMLSISIAFNAISVHATCTAVFVAVAAVLGFGFGSVRTLGRITWLAWVGITSILVAILIVTIAVGIEDRPAAAPQDGPWSSDYELFKRPTFHAAASALSSLTFAFAGTPAFFPIVSEMRDPRYYSRSLMICQSLVTAIYLAIGCVVYYYCGSYVASPALGSAGANLKKVAYGCALPGLIVTATLYVHLPGKYLLIRLLRNSKHLALNTPTHWVSWLGSTLGVTLLAYIIASAIPVFSDLVSLIGALLGTLLSLQPMGCMWLYDHWSEGKLTKTPRWMVMVCWSIFIIVIGTFLMIAGTYGAVVDIIASYQETGGSAAWSCADNSGSV